MCDDDAHSSGPAQGAPPPAAASGGAPGGAGVLAVLAGHNMKNLLKFYARIMDLPVIVMAPVPAAAAVGSSSISSRSRDGG